ncbi:hypothetical protein B0H19DRAFT_1148768 [Mycena capillaripes]|nr:hypothetical protein B0H19DRAFT_1148768 [Mycena capillaripes]
MQTEHFYDYTRAQGISDEALLQFITARIRHSPATLTHVHVQFERQMTLDILPSLEPFIEAGLDVSLTYVRPSPLQISPWQGLAEGPPPLSWGPPPQPGLW